MRQSLFKRNVWKGVLSLLLLMTLLTNRFVLVHHHAYAVGVSPRAVSVYGQAGSFTTSTSGTTTTTFNTPRKALEDTSGNLYVVDSGNNRVLYFLAGSTTATRVYGQGGSFTTGTTNTGGLSANSLSGPHDLDLDTSGNLYVADSGNNRVLYFPAGSTTATNVYGQSSFILSIFGLGATSLNTPMSMVVDTSGNLYIADSGNDRVVYFLAGSTTSSQTYAQSCFLFICSGTILSNPTGVALDGNKNLYIADSGDSRTLYYPAGSTTPVRVYGQGGNLSSTTANNGGISVTSLNQPAAITFGRNGTIYISDTVNNRVLKFQTSLSINTQPPTSTQVSSSFTVIASLVDGGSGAVFSDFTGTVTAVIKSGTGTTGATLGGTTSVAASSGVVSFSTLTINASGTGYVLTLSIPGVTSVDSSTLTITMPTPGGYWKFDESNGTTTADFSGNNNTGTITGASWVAGKTNTALGFNGTSNSVSMGTAPAALQMSTSSFTVMSWFKTSATTGSQRLVSMGNASWANGYQLAIGPNASTCTGCVGGSVGAGGTQANSLSFYTTSSFNDGNWHHAVMVIDQNANTAQLYVDSVAQVVATQSGTCGTAVGIIVTIVTCNSLNATGTGTFNLGSYNGASNFFTGSLDVTRIYGSALSIIDLQTLYTNDVNTLSEYTANVSFTTTPGSTATYTMPIAVTYQLPLGPGWSLSITSTTLISGINTLATTASKITSVTNTCIVICTPTTMTNTVSSFPITIPAATTVPTAVKVFSTASGTGIGAYIVTLTISVTVPYVVKIGTYTSTVILLATTGP